MSVVIEERDPVAGLAWTVLRGERTDVMRALGRTHAEAIHAQRVAEDGGWSANVRRARGVAAARFAAVVAATKSLLPLEADELAAIAEGAEVDAHELWAQNLRGDLGRDGTGCSDVSFVGRGGVVLGHNEDGDGDLRGAIRLVTLRIEGDPDMTALWYPGMLPSNAFVTTAAGLAFGMDHVPVRVANQGGAGRHFVARRAQRQQTGDAARAALADIACAGGFAFDVADARSRRTDLIENAAGRVAQVPGGARATCHTNHLRAVDGTREGLAVAPDDVWLVESRSRLAALRSVADEADDAETVRAALRAERVLGRSADLYTLASIVVDQATDTITVQTDGDPWRGRWDAFARGERKDA